MNKHFEDAWYYLRRAGTHLERGIREELEPFELKIREATGREKTREPSRSGTVRSNIQDVEKKAKRRSRDAVRDARKRIGLS
ncbi:DUF7553 family protein [Haladaptatus sp. NG-WS-4]